MWQRVIRNFAFAVHEEGLGNDLAAFDLELKSANMVVVHDDFECIHQVEDAMLLILVQFEKV